MIRTMAAVLLGLLFVAGEATAQPCPTGGLTTLTNGTNADATQVMANFTYVANCVNNYSPPTVPPGSIMAYSGFVLPSGWLWANGAAVSRTTYAGLLAALTTTSTVTITIASPGVVTWNNHGLSGAWPVRFSTTGALPTGLSAGVTYYIVSATTNTFQVAAAPGGTAINTSGTQSGTQTATFAPYGNGDNATTFDLPDLRGRIPYGLDNLGGATAVNRVTSAGSGINGTSPGGSGGSQFLQNHVHQVQTRSDLSAVGAGATAFAPGGAGSSTTAPAGTGDSQNMPPALMMGYIIKY